MYPSLLRNSKLVELAKNVQPTLDTGTHITEQPSRHTVETIQRDGHVDVAEAVTDWWRSVVTPPAPPPALVAPDPLPGGDYFSRLPAPITAPAPAPTRTVAPASFFGAPAAQLAAPAPAPAPVAQLAAADSCGGRCGESKAEAAPVAAASPAVLTNSRNVAAPALPAVLQGNALGVPRLALALVVIVLLFFLAARGGGGLSWR